MISLRRLFDTRYQRASISIRAHTLRACHMGRHQWGFNPLFGTTNCKTCGVYDPDAEEPSVEVLLDKSEEILERI